MSARTRVVATGPSNGYAAGQWLAQYWDPEFAVWFDIGNPHGHVAAAEEAAAEHERVNRAWRR